MLWVVLVLFAAVAGCVSDVDVSLLVLSLIAKKKKKKKRAFRHYFDSIRAD